MDRNLQTDPVHMARMLEAVRADARLASEFGRGALSERVLSAMAEVPRHFFVPEHLCDQAYGNYPLPIGHGQTISQPYIVALMTELLTVDGTATVLEVGTGSGYQTAVLAQLVRHVYTIELVEALGTEAAARLAALGIRNVTCRIGDGYEGWPENAPYDGVIVTAATPEVPPALTEQLKLGARLVIPVGARFGPQSLQVITRTAAEPRVDSVMPVAFVPLVHTPHE